ncbi:MAG: sulfatase [Candidatus Omnitrophica bacterium]|nr:sulfatase [Candidatus Omnitrophota bacterium]
MKLSEHMKLGIFAGFLVGLIIGIVDIIARITVFSFEWFEFYQTLSISLLLFILFFVCLSFFTGLILRIGNIKITKERILIFQTANAIILLILFYVGVITNLLLLPGLNFWSSVSLKVNFFVVIVIGVIYVGLLTKGKDVVVSIISFIKKKKVKGIINNVIFIAITFITISFILDLYSLYYFPKATSNPKLEGYPNIIIITLDTTRADHLSFQGYELNTTPNLDRFAEESIVFENAASQSPWTLPAHASIFTGKYPSKHNATLANQMLDYKEETLAEILRERGYNTVGFGASLYTKGKYGISQGFTTYRDRLDFFAFRQTFKKFDIKVVIAFFFPIIEELVGIDGEKTSEEQNELVFKWIDKNKDSPFFMFIHYFDPHSPYNLGSQFKSRFTNEIRDYKEVVKLTGNPSLYLYHLPIERYVNASPDLVKYMIALYDTEIFYLDHNLGKLFNKIDDLGIKNNTIIIITADHGEEFYDHGGFGHSRLYEELIHVPLIIYFPREFKAKRIEKRVETINIFPTILDILQIEVPENIDGVSLLPLIKNHGGYDRVYGMSELFRRPEKGETKQQTAISDNNWKLIEVGQWENLKSEEETMPSILFNLKTDPKEQKNLYHSYPKKGNLLQKYILNRTSNSQKD